MVHVKTAIIETGLCASSLIIGVILGYAAASKAAMRSLAMMIGEGVLGYGPDYPKPNRLQAQANKATTRRRAQSRIIKP
jgi:myo-inositol-1-phosphate synthase